MVSLHSHTSHGASRIQSAGCHHQGAGHSPSQSVWHDGRTGSHSCIAGLCRKGYECTPGRDSCPAGVSAPVSPPHPGAAESVYVGYPLLRLWLPAAVILAVMDAAAVFTRLKHLYHLTSTHI